MNIPVTTKQLIVRCAYGECSQDNSEEKVVPAQENKTRAATEISESGYGLQAVFSRIHDFSYC